MPAYDLGLFYPVRIGEVFQKRYEVLRKMGYGANSTVWMCRDLWQVIFAMRELFSTLISLSGLICMWR